ncbi:uncharacterized protein LOC142340782 [Convolutriloba macropyga]|uniref:uncharacterized protein LOC142340782 n=1 Tax=Convolutriloba macropyga TaxID=536237 RepID=UPI003F51BDBF
MEKVKEYNFEISVGVNCSFALLSIILGSVALGGGYTALGTITLVANLSPACIMLFMLLHNRMSSKYKNTPKNLLIFTALMATVALVNTTIGAVFAAKAYHNGEKDIPIDGNRVVVAPCIFGVILCLINATMISTFYSTITDEKLF